MAATARSGTARRAGTASLFWPEARSRSKPAAASRATRNTHRRYVEAATRGLIVGCLYLPNGNPAPGPGYDYKLRWFDCLAAHAAEVLASEQPVVLAGDYNVMPTDIDVYASERWVDDALFRPEVRGALHRLTAQGWNNALRALHPDQRIYTAIPKYRVRYRQGAGLGGCRHPDHL
jgi:exodeoxyribonuclease III